MYGRRKRIIPPGPHEGTCALVPADRMNIPSLPPSVHPVFRAVVRATAPAAESLDAAGWAGVARIVEHALSRRSPGVRRQIALFLRLLSWAALFRHGKFLERLSVERAREFLYSVERAPILLVRRGFWGIRTLALMGYYARPEARADVGYKAAPGGWSARALPTEKWSGRGTAGGPEPGVLAHLGLEDEHD